MLHNTQPNTLNPKKVHRQFINYKLSK